MAGVYMVGVSMSVACKGTMDGAQSTRVRSQNRLLTRCNHIRTYGQRRASALPACLPSAGTHIR